MDVTGLQDFQLKLNRFDNLNDVVNLHAHGWDDAINLAKSRQGLPVVVVSYDGKRSGEILVDSLKKLDKFPVQIIYAYNQADIESIKKLSRYKINMVILPGGENVPPSYYDSKHAYDTDEVEIGKSHQKTYFELHLLRWAEENKIPSIGICRGLQVMAVYKGLGIKNVERAVSHNKKSVMHLSGSIGDNPFYQLCQQAYHEQRDGVQQILSSKSARPAYAIKVKCVHSQCIDLSRSSDKVMPFKVFGVAPDGTIELAKFASRTGAYLLGMQNHPEKIYQDNFLANQFMCYIKSIAYEHFEQGQRTCTILDFPYYSMQKQKDKPLAEGKHEEHLSDSSEAVENSTEENPLERREGFKCKKTDMI